MSRINLPFVQHSDDAGNPLIEGLLHFYEVGTSTLKDTFADAELTVPNSNPVKLSGSGREPNIYGSGTYRVTLSDSGGAQIEERNNVGSDSSEGYGSDWDSTIIYNIPDVVQFDGIYYDSKINNNIGNTPDTSPASWSQRASFGSGQTWQDVTGDRAIGPGFTNSTGRPIQISIYLQAGAGSASIDVGGIVSVGVVASNEPDTILVIVPDGVLYTVTAVGATLFGWRELR